MNKFQKLSLITLLGLIGNLLAVHSAAIDYEQFPVRMDDEMVFYDFNQEVPHSRHVRQVFGEVSQQHPGGATATVGAAGNLFNRNGHNVDGHAQASQNFHPKGPVNLGGGLDYQGPRGGASVNANHVPRFGTDVSATGNANLWKSNNGMSRLDGTANYNQHFGGPFGRSRPNWGAGLNFNHRF